VADAVCAQLLIAGQRESLNMRGVYLEVLGDLLGSAAVIVAAIVITMTGYEAADPIASVVIGLLILPRTWRLLREAVDVLLEATPRGVDLDEVRRHILETKGVSDVHDLHAWTITSGLNVVSAHVVTVENANPGEILDRLGTCLAGDFDIEHSTFQLEPSDRRRIEEAAHRRGSEQPIAEPRSRAGVRGRRKAAPSLRHTRSGRRPPGRPRISECSIGRIRRAGGAGRARRRPSRRSHTSSRLWPPHILGRELTLESVPPRTSLLGRGRAYARFIEVIPRKAMTAPTTNTMVAR
jgi:hypothetical protein